MKGRIHSIESMGLVDGPGIRAVVFMQGCRLRCKYCHNPDTWDLNGAKEMEAADLIRKISRFKPYFKDNGGVTFSGGEPLMQPEFLAECLRLSKEAGIHTCIDTAGQMRLEGTEETRQQQIEEILKYTDLILMDVKHLDEGAYRELTGTVPAPWLDWMKAVEESGIPVWIRQVVIPGLTDSEEYLNKLSEYVKTLNHVEKVQLLPYHDTGKQKYADLGIDYPLKGVPEADREKTAETEKKLFGYL